MVQCVSIQLGVTTMRRQCITQWLMVLTLAVGSMGTLRQVEAQAPPPPPSPPAQGVPQPPPQDLAPDPDVKDGDGLETLTRGPIHEAFAEPVVFDPRPAPVVPKEPPAPVEEVPPAEKPEGANVVWIPGYWAWDDQRNNFLWISG